MPNIVISAKKCVPMQSTSVSGIVSFNSITCWLFYIRETVVEIWQSSLVVLTRVASFVFLFKNICLDYHNLRYNKEELDKMWLYMEFYFNKDI